MPVKWKRGGFYERAILSYFEDHEKGTYKDIRNYVMDLPTKKWGTRRKLVPDAHTIGRVLTANGVKKKRELLQGDRSRGRNYRMVYYRPDSWNGKTIPDLIRRFFREEGEGTAEDIHAFIKSIPVTSADRKEKQRIHVPSTDQIAAMLFRKMGARVVGRRKVKGKNGGTSYKRVWREG